MPKTLSSRGLNNKLISIVLVTSWFDSVFIRVTCWINFTINFYHKHDLQLPDYNVGKYFQQKVNILGEIIVFTISAVKGFQHI